MRKPFSMKLATVNLLKFTLCVVIYTAVFMIVMAFIPFSRGFTEIYEKMNESQTPASSMVAVLSFIWNCFAAYFIIRHASIGGKKLFVRLLYVMFFVMYFMPQIWGAESADVHGVTMLDMLLIMIPGLFSLLATIPLMIKFFQNKNAVETVGERNKLSIKGTAIKIGLGGLVFAGAYIIFLLAVQRNIEEYRMFYADTAWMQAAHGENFAGLLPLFFSPFFRGVTNGFFVLPLLSMITKNKFMFITAICLVVIAPGFGLIAPSPLFPDTVRFLLMASMTVVPMLSGIFIGNFMWKKGLNEHETDIKKPQFVITP